MVSRGSIDANGPGVQESVAVDILYIAIPVILFIAVAGSFVALWWWKLADRWMEEEHKRFKTKPKTGPDEVVIRADGSTVASTPDAPETDR